uniref:Uncharacterized protein n=1 Tax=Siphoviridae sp. ctDsE1 TaxID=2825390 RepID=A0A8S5TYI0_9CAUD|nr:MAG TPA: hypothetical protein [Siphoviridae sp. ctDsE1]
MLRRDSAISGNLCLRLTGLSDSFRNFPYINSYHFLTNFLVDIFG